MNDDAMDCAPRPHLRSPPSDLRSLLAARRSPLRVFFVALIAVLLLAPFAVSPARALDGESAADYREAKKKLADNPAAAFRTARALPTFERADDLRLELLARAAVRSGHTTKAKQTLAELRSATPNDDVRFWAGLTQAELRLLGSDVEAAADLTEQLADDAGDLEIRPAERRFFRSRLVRLQHDLAKARDESEKAREFATTLETEYPSTAAARHPGLVDIGDLEASQRYVRAKSLYDAWAYERARSVFQSLLDDDRYGNTARWYLGHIALNKLRDRPDAAADYFGALIEDSSYEAEALYNKARTQMVQEKYDRTLEILDTYEQRYPGGRRIEDVYYYRGWLPYDHNENEKAVDGFQQYIDRYGKGASRSSYVYGFLAWTYMRMGEWKKAIATYDEMEHFGNMLVWGKALYWQAHAYRKLEQPEKALEKLDELRETYPVTYYGVLGEQMRARINGNDPSASKVWWPDDAGGADDEPRLNVRHLRYRYLDSREEDRWERVQALVELGERERARRTLEPIYDDMRDSMPTAQKDEFVHAIGQFVGDYHKMWVRSTGGSISALPEPPDPSSLDAPMAYPRAYRDVVEDVAEEFEIPPYLMWSIMRQESRYRPAQVSHADAVGALQMIPKTARKVAADLGTTYNPRTFFKPEVGFRFSGFYMKKLLKTFDGLLVPMAAAYNSGPRVVARWFSEDPNVSFPWLIEEFAYNEGRNYCRKVAEHFVRYLYLYEDDEKRRRKLLDKLFPTSRDITIPDDVGY